MTHLQPTVLILSLFLEGIRRRFVPSGAGAHEHVPSSRRTDISDIFGLAVHEFLLTRVSSLSFRSQVL